ncbi:MAG: type II secretion system GspH family protein [Lachnospiraceae bacterium]|nr:type II secretion system GspH family protein [Lachnospiraceae bacterium]
MRKVNEKRGFTLAELLIVVAIIAVLVAIAIPIFTQQLERSRESTDMSNVRAAYAEAVADYLSNGASSAVSATVSARQTEANWQNSENGTLYTRVKGSEGKVSVTAQTSPGSYVVTVASDGTVTVTNSGS